MVSFYLGLSFYNPTQNLVFYTSVQHLILSE